MAVGLGAPASIDNDAWDFTGGEVELVAPTRFVVVLHQVKVIDTDIAWRKVLCVR